MFTAIPENYRHISDEQTKVSKKKKRKVKEENKKEAKNLSLVELKEKASKRIEAIRSENR